MRGSGWPEAAGAEGMVPFMYVCVCACVAFGKRRARESIRDCLWGSARVGAVP